MSLVQTVETQARSTEPNVEIVEAAAVEIQEVGDKSASWLAQKLDTSAEEFFKELGKWSGRAAAAGLSAGAIWLLGLLEKLQPLLGHLQKWIVSLAG